MNVPNYKQTDSRWANTLIGSSGKTISQIGCATTAVAMMESYRQGRTIYPDEMSRKLTYSSSGDLYWPSDYHVVTSSTNYLQGIYNQLSKGKPVLFGAKKSNGSQHWVVITGFTGGGSSSASSFTVNDPVPTLARIYSNCSTNILCFISIFIIDRSKIRTEASSGASVLCFIRIPAGSERSGHIGRGLVTPFPNQSIENSIRFNSDTFSFSPIETEPLRPQPSAQRQQWKSIFRQFPKAMEKSTPPQSGIQAFAEMKSMPIPDRCSVR